MWSDAATNAMRQMTVQFALGSLLNYERGVAFDEAGNRKAAAFRLRRFVDEYDQPPIAHRVLVEDAKRRLATLEKTDAPARKSIRAN